MRFSVVIVNYNTAGFLARLLESVRSQSPSPSEIVVVDNGSEDGSVEVAERFGARVVRLPRNYGFAAGANVGYEVSRGDPVFFLNTDLILAEGYFEAMLSAISREEVGAVSSKVVNLPRGDEGKGGTLNFCLRYVGGVLGEREQLVVSGGSFAVKRRAVGEKPFEDFFFAYYEDVLLSFRMRCEGWELVRVPEAVAFHWESATASKLPRVFLDGVKERNRWLVLLSVFPVTTLFYFLPFFVVDDLALLWRCFKGKKSLVGVLAGRLSVLPKLGWLLRERRRFSACEVGKKLFPLFSCRFPGIPPALTTFYFKLLNVEFREVLECKRG